jgi:hypothetical protein
LLRKVTFPEKSRQSDVVVYRFYWNIPKRAIVMVVLIL